MAAPEVDEGRDKLRLEADLANMRSYALETSTYGERLHIALSDATAASFAYDRLSHHLEAARRQMSRYMDARAVAAASSAASVGPGPYATQVELRASTREAKQRMRPIFNEIHFYFVSWAGCRNMLQVLVGRPEFLEAKKVFDGLRKHFELYTAGRNSFEHFHDRLPGQKTADKVKDVKDGPTDNPHKVYVGLKGHTYLHSNLRIDISPASLELLENCVSLCSRQFTRKSTLYY